MNNKNTQLQRVLGSGFAFSACIGGIIGLGILRTPGEITTVVTDPLVYVGLWLLGGLFALMSIGVIAELVGVTPRSGGNYPLVKKAYGPYPGFLIGWADWLSFCATLALKVTVMVEYLALLLPLETAWQQPLALVVISLFAVLQMFSVRLGAGIQQVAAVGMGLGIVAFTLALLIGGPVEWVEPATTTHSPIGAWGLVAAAIIFTYDGWIGATYFGSEIKGGGGVVARACVKSVAIILVLYVALNAALAYSVPLAALAGSELALSQALQLVFSERAATVVTVAAVLILLAHQNLNFMEGPRVLHALSSDGLGSRHASQVANGGNPVVAVLLTWMLGVILILSGGFEFLLQLNVLLFVFLYLALLVGVIILRRREPTLERPYRAWGYPTTTVLCITGWASVCGFMAWSAPESAVSAVALVVISLPVYLALKRIRRLSIQPA